MSNEDMASRIQVYRKKIEKIRVKQMKREKFKHLLKTLRYQQEESEVWL